MNDFKAPKSPIVGEGKSPFSANEQSSTLISNNEIDLSNPEKAATTIERMLANYEIGSKLRRLRLRKKIALADLGKHTGLSASMLSQLENGKLVPTLPTLSRIALVFDVGLEYFFDYKRSKRVFAVTRASERLRFPDRPDNPLPSFFFEVLAYSAMEKRVSAYIAEFPERSLSDVHEHYHEGSELVHVLSGILVIRYASEDYILEAGDSVYFDAIEPHSYRGQSNPGAQAFVVTAKTQV